MESKIVKAIGLKNYPIAVLWTDERPAEGVPFQEGKVACMGPMLVAASKGRTVYFDQKAIGCPGGRASLGFGFDDTSDEFPGGIEYFLSTGNKELYETEEGRKLAATMPALAEGEQYAFHVL